MQKPLEQFEALVWQSGLTRGMHPGFKMVQAEIGLLSKRFSAGFVACNELTSSKSDRAAADGIFQQPLQARADPKALT